LSKHPDNVIYLKYLSVSFCTVNISEWCQQHKMAEGGLLVIGCKKKKKRKSVLLESEGSSARAVFAFNSLHIALTANPGSED